MKISNYQIGNQTRNLLACSGVPQPPAPLRTPTNKYCHIIHAAFLLQQHPAQILYHTGSLHTQGHPKKAAEIRPAITEMQSSKEKLQFDVLSYQYCM
jgi:hypothetical protein